MNWGMGKLDFCELFRDDDSLFIQLNYNTTLDSADTVYSNALDATNIELVGVYKIVLALDSSDAATDSNYVGVRLGYNFGTYRSSDVEWGPWKHLAGPLATETLTELNIAQADSSWWGPCNFIQYRIYSVTGTADTTTFRFMDFRN
jgi:hypothetical protein